MVIATLFSGCSLAPQDTSNIPVQTFAISKSIWKSTDGGVRWEARDKSENKGSVSDFDVLSMVVNPYNSQNVYIGLRSGGILKTENGGDTWKFLTIFTSEKVYGLALDPANPKTIYASGVYNGRGKIFKSQDGGETWSEIYASASAGPLVISILVDSKNASVIYASTSDNEAMKSEDGGSTWKNIFRANGPILKFSIDRNDSNTVYFLVDGGKIFRSQDAGGAFEEITSKISSGILSGSNFSSIECDPNNSGWVYLAGEAGISLSKDKGEKWIQIISLSDPKNFPITAFAVSPGDSRNMVYAAGQASYKSDDGGQTWATFEFDTKRTISIIKYDSNNPQNIYLGFKR